LFEVVLAQCQDLHEALKREDGDEDLIDDEENVLEVVCLLVMLDSHRHHVEQYDNHYKYVELLVGDHIEHQPLNYELQYAKHCIALGFSFTFRLLFKKFFYRTTSFGKIKIHSTPSSMSRIYSG
jgi:hypothetical protein